MTTFAISMVKDEADIIASTVGHMLGQVDHVIVADNGSTDGTRDILLDLGVEVLDDPDPAYTQAAKMTALAGLARERSARWVIPFDADEWWFSPDGRIADVLGQRWLRNTYVAVAALWDHVPTALDDLDETDPVARMRWRWTNRSALHKVGCQARPDLRIEQGNHNARYDREPLVAEGLLQIRHFPYRSPEQFIRKVRNGAAAYAASDLPETMGGHWRAYGRILAEHGEQVLLDEVYRRWFFRTDPTTPTVVEGEPLPELVEDPVPCRVSTS